MDGENAAIAESCRQLLTPPKAGPMLRPSEHHRDDIFPLDTVSAQLSRHMQLSISGKQLDVGDALRSHVEDHLEASVSKYFADAIDASVVFSRVGHLHRSDISVHVGHDISVQSHGEAAEPYAAFDTASTHIAKQLRRFKRRLRNRQRGQSRSAKAKLDARQRSDGDSMESDQE